MAGQVTAEVRNGDVQSRGAEWEIREMLGYVVADVQCFVWKINNVECPEERQDANRSI